MIRIVALLRILSASAHVQKGDNLYNNNLIDEIPFRPELRESGPFSHHPTIHVIPRHGKVSVRTHHQLKNKSLRHVYPVSTAPDSNTELTDLEENPFRQTLTAKDEGAYAINLIHDCASRLRCDECIIDDHCFYCGSTERCHARFFLDEGVCPLTEIYYFGTCKIKFYALSWGLMALFVLIVLVASTCVLVAVLQRRKYRISKLQDNWNEGCPKYRLSAVEKAYYKS